MKDNHYIQCVDQLLAVIEKTRLEKNLYHSAPIVLRFVKASEAFISPMHGRDTCMVEIIMAKDTERAKDMYAILEKAMYAFDSRMHWGQLNFLSADRVKAMYPSLDQWKKISKVLNSTGVFNNPFSYSVGLSHEP